MNLLIKGCTILPMTASDSDPSKYFVGNVGIADGKIVFADADPATTEAFRARCGESLHEIDGQNKVAMPGFINLHNHVSMSLMRSYADDMPLMPWLNDKIWPFEAKLNGDDIYLGARLGIAEMLLGGTTTFVDMYWHSDRVAEAVLEMGIRGVVCPTFVGANYDNFEPEAIRMAEKYGLKSGRVQVMLAPHAAYTCPPDTLKKALKIADQYGLGIQIHVSETLDEQRMIREQYGKTPVAHLRDVGLFERPVLAAHCVYVDEADMEIMAKYGASVAHNPQSNMKLASGIAPVSRMLEAGVNVGIGTDGPSSNNDLDMWEELRTASLLQKVSTSNPCALTAYETLRMATVYGAKAIGREGELGVIAPGALADLMLVDLRRPHLSPQNDLIANLVYCGKASDVDTVIVDGSAVVEGGKLLTADADTLCSEAGERVNEIKNRA